ncbi:MAG TPA: hypothetical protein VJS91_08120, partial [Nitrososphaeraceae archaeon]|nr:hypothetical protein [Nitrososphaeraceae archaeon]
MVNLASNKWSNQEIKRGYRILDPSLLYRGKGYGDWASDWFNWFVSANADKRNSGPVAFLRSQGIPLSVEDGSKRAPENISNISSIDPNYPKGNYANEPNIRIGSERLVIYEDQAVFWPILVGFWVGSEPYADFGYMQDYTGVVIDHGDNPPDTNQIKVNKDEIVLPTDLSLLDFRIMTSVFPAVIPEADYGTSVKDFLEMTHPPGHYPALVEGYFLMLKFKPGFYYVRSRASSPREFHGPYTSELFYGVEVLERAQPRGRVTRFQKFA